MYYALDEDGKVREILDPENNHCHPWAGGDYNGHCGGCDECIMAQVLHWGGKIIEMPEEDKLLDRLGVYQKYNE